MFHAKNIQRVADCTVLIREIIHVVISNTTQNKYIFCEFEVLTAVMGYWTRARDGRLSRKQNTAKVNCKLHSQ
jgi:hypothetical protein